MPIEVRLSGSVTAVRAEQSQKANSPIEVRLSGKSGSVTALYEGGWKEHLPIEVRLSGRVAAVRAEQPAKAQLPINRSEAVRQRDGGEGGAAPEGAVLECNLAIGYNCVPILIYRVRRLPLLFLPLLPLLLRR